MTATLVDGDPYVTLVDNTHFLGKIPPGSELTFQDAFLLSISDDCPNEHDVGLELVMDDGARATWTSDYALRVFRPDLLQVWNDVDAMACDLRAPSATSAMDEVFRKHQTRLDDYVGGLPHVRDQVGGVFAIDGRVLGLELMDHPATMRKLLPKLIRSYALDAIASRVLGLTSAMEQRIPSSRRKLRKCRSPIEPTPTIRKCMVWSSFSICPQGVSFPD